jgi:hypothetical protein
VHQHVGVAADRRGKVRVVLKRQTKVANIFGRVDSFSHERSVAVRIKVLLGFALDIFEQFGDIACRLFFLV